MTPWLEQPAEHDGLCDCPGYPSVDDGWKYWMAEGWHFRNRQDTRTPTVKAGQDEAVSRCPAYWRKTVRYHGKDEHRFEVIHNRRLRRVSTERSIKEGPNR